MFLRGINQRAFFLFFFFLKIKKILKTIQFFYSLILFKHHHDGDKNKPTSCTKIAHKLVVVEEAKT